MKIITLQAENIKKLVAVEIRPDGNVVQITGKNGQGKTSVLDSIWWALGGLDNVQETPIRIGTKQARIRLDLGEIIVTRTFREKDGGEVTSSITVESADGTRFPSPQKMLDDFLGQLTFDPLAFSRMPAKQQFETLRTFVPEVDFDEIDAANKADFEARTDINRRARERRIQADKILVTANGPTDVIDESALVDELQKAATHNAEIETRKEKRLRARTDADVLRQRAADLRKEAVALEEKAAALEKQLAEAPELPQPKDVTELRTRIDGARKRNEEIRARIQKQAFEKEAADLEAESALLTKAMADRESAKRAAVASAKLPVEGISFGEGAVLLHDLPFDQASDAEQLSASIAIAMAMNPKLRVIRVRDGSLLDEDSMRLLAELAEEKDYQVWIERVDGSGRVGFVIDDGHVREAAPARA